MPSSTPSHLSLTFHQILEGASIQAKSFFDEQNDIINSHKEARDHIESLYMNAQVHHKSRGGFGSR